MKNIVRHMMPSELSINILMGTVYVDRRNIQLTIVCAVQLHVLLPVAGHVDIW